MSNDKIHRLRKRGRLSFVIKYGVITWGIGSSLLASIAIPLIPWVDYTFTQLLAITLPTFCVCGMLFGFLMWRFLVAPVSDADAKPQGAEPNE
ncbi:MAG: hypothetical protein HKN82_14880 [Akkermansiaceae bacterium]|nr:hypothetical protein [Akkermansiaceae bacterium]